MYIADSIGPLQDKTGNILRQNNANIVNSVGEFEKSKKSQLFMNFPKTALQNCFIIDILIELTNHVRTESKLFSGCRPL